VAQLNRRRTVVVATGLGQFGNGSLEAGMILRLCYPWSRVRACGDLCLDFDSDVDVQSAELAEIY
jgi:hypothetical protein